MYSLLMEGSADYGKEMRAALDWSDRELLATVLKRRIAYSIDDESVHFTTVLNQISVSHVDGESTIEHMVGRSLMRPRNLLKIFRFSLGSAINMGHERIEIEDIREGCKTYSQDLVTEFNREITQVFPKANKLIYEFSEEESAFLHDDLITLIEIFGLEGDEPEKVVSFLLYYGVIGVQKSDEEPLYIYDVDYDIEMLRVRIRKWSGTMKYILNPALWPALRVRSETQAMLV